MSNYDHLLSGICGEVCTLKPHQNEAIEAIKQHFGSSNAPAVCAMTRRAGKTTMGTILPHALKAQRTLFVATCFDQIRAVLRMVEHQKDKTRDITFTTPSDHSFKTHDSYNLIIIDDVAYYKEGEVEKFLKVYDRTKIVLLSTMDYKDQKTVYRYTWSRSTTGVQIRDVLFGPES